MRLLALTDCERGAIASGTGHVYVHAWRRGDVVLWDTRCLLHAGSGYDADRHRRDVRQTRVGGTCPTLQKAG